MQGTDGFCMKKIQFLVLVWLTVLMNVEPCLSDDKFTHLTIKDGLTQSSVKAIYQDARGYLWFGTIDGLNRYDGYHITRYYHDPTNPNSLASNDISCLYENPYDSTLYIGTEDAGLSLYNQVHDCFISFSASTQIENRIFLGHVTDMVATGRESLWIASVGKGIYRYNAVDSTFHFSGFSSNPAFSQVNCLEADAKGKLWIGTNHGLYFWSPATAGSDREPEKVELTDQKQTLHINALKFDAKGNLFIGTESDGLFKYHPTSQQKTQYFKTEDKHSLLSNNITDLLITKDGSIWVATPDGLCKMPEADGHFLTYKNNPFDPESLNSNAILKLHEDKSGILWIGTYLGGVNKLDPNTNRFPKYRNLFPTEGRDQSHLNILTICTDNNRSVWVNTSKGLLEIDQAYFSADSSEPSKVKPFNKPIYGNILFSKAHGLFLSLRNGINQRLPDGSFEELSPLIFEQTGKRISSFFTAVTDSDGMIWFSTGAGLLKYNPKNKTFKLIPITNQDEEVISTIIFKIVESYEGKLMMGSSDGALYKFDRHLGQFEKVIPFRENATSPSFSRIFTIHESRPGIFWLGTNSGLYRYNDQTRQTERFLDEDGILNNMVYGILGDKHGKIWCTTNNGLSVYDPGKNSFRNYTHHDGLQSNEFNQDAYYKSEDGTFFMGGIDGLNVFRPENIQPNAFVPQVIIDRMEILYDPVSPGSHPDILDKQLSETKEITLNHKQSTFSFEYLALSYSQSSRNKYQYMLEGFDDKWVNAGNRRIASYTNVPPGEYIFKVKGSNNDGFWNETPSSIKITITPPFWNTAWFKTLLVLFLSAVLYLIYRQRIRSTKQQRILLEKRINEKTNALLEQKQQIEKQNEELVKINARITEKNKKLNAQNHKINEQHNKLLKLSEEIKRVNQARLKFFTTISHEFRTPLTLIINPLKETIRNINEINKHQLQHQLKTVYGNACKLLVLINELLDFRKIDTNKMNLDISKIEFVSFVQQIALLFNDLSTKNDITFDFFSSQPVMEVWADSRKIEKTITNILSNAFKYTSPGGAISIKADFIEQKEDENQVVLSITDNGEGIEESLIPSIFQRFYQSDSAANARHVGSGLGLAVAKKYIDLHGGEISVKSKGGEGSTFTVKIPADKHKDLAKPPLQPDNSHISPDTEIVLASLSNYVPLNINDIETIEDRNKPELLVVEDDPSLSGYLKEVLSTDYRVVRGNSAEEGFRLATSKQPALILCDVMLPGMNGFEFCEKVKSHSKTRHIPLILLSALSDQENQLTGLKHGADDYITKPFDIQHLIVKIKNLIELRLKLQVKYAPETSPESADINQKKDKQFINKLAQCVEENISDPSFNVDKLCTLMDISHSQIYRKVSSLTDLSISEFIRNIRLKKAAGMLLANNMRVGEIAYQVGFNDPNYFTKCFTRLYEQTPSEYVKNTQR